MKRWFHIIYWCLGLCDSWFGHRWSEWRPLPSGKRVYRICQACADHEADPPFAHIPREELRKAWRKVNKAKLKLVKHTRNELGKDAN